MNQSLSVRIDERNLPYLPTKAMCLDMAFANFSLTRMRGAKAFCCFLLPLLAVFTVSVSRAQTDLADPDDSVQIVYAIL